MTPRKMGVKDEQVIAECLRAVAQGPFFSEYDFRVLFWASRSELLEVAEMGDFDSKGARRLVGLTFLHLLEYPHGREADWGEWISASRATVEEVDHRWRARQPPVQFEVRKVHGPARIDGRFYRVVEYGVTNGGHGLSGQVWSEGRWVDYESGPGCKAIIAAEPSPEEEVRRLGVDWPPSSPVFNPFFVDPE